MALELFQSVPPDMGLLIILGFIFASIITIVFILFEYIIFVKDKRRAFILRNESGHWQRIQVLKLTPTQQKVRVKIGKASITHTLNMEMPAFRYRNRWVYFIDVVKGQIPLGKVDDKNVISPELLDAMLARKLPEQLVAGVEKFPFTSQIIFILIGIAMGILGGWIIGSKFPI